MQKNITTKLITGLIATGLLFPTVSTTAAFSAVLPRTENTTATAPAAGTWSGSITFKLVLNGADAQNENDYTEKVVVFDNAPLDTPLGLQGTLPNTMEGLYWSRPFAGWSDQPKANRYTSENVKLYSANNTLGDVLKDFPDGKVVLHAIYDGPFDGKTSFFGITVPRSHEGLSKHNRLRIHQGLTKETVLTDFISNPNFVLKDYIATERTNPASATPGVDQMGFADTDLGHTYTDHKVVGFYHPSLGETALKYTSNFNFNKGVATVVRNNPWIYGVGALSESEVLLTYKVDPNTTVAEKLTGFTLDAAIFRLKRAEVKTTAGVKDITVENRQPAVDTGDIHETTFDLSIPADIDRTTITEIRLIAEPRQRQGVGDTEEAKTAQAKIDEKLRALPATVYTRDMTLSNQQGISITAEQAKNLATNAADGTDLVATIAGTVDGTVTFKPFPRLGKYDLSIPRVASNVLMVDFVYPKVNFDLNSVTLGDTRDQVAKAAFEPKTEIEKDGAKLLVVAENEFPQVENFTVNDKTYRFLGWTTDAAGTQPFDATTDIRQDTTVYAKWAQEVYPVEPNLLPAEKCGVEPTLMVPEVTGIKYEKTMEGKVATVVATPLPGYVFTTGNQTETWTYTIKAVECKVITPKKDKTKTPKAPAKPKLAQTGTNVTGVGVIALLTLFGGIAVVRRARR
ncbi:repeat protein [Gleimia coleocanis DSM 15436]|uniref:Repeat protein n=1 Tax=Gleimia coleocanis DSM 15436 TaxID=525245 RepID=C0VZD3_9ACTO|nr:InlB B-repeat-containing protein [Gleimia coleocanis]EEH64234.1 repeat protein [Gleimia coleocanis DSM 15436]